ncbi:hypothetical protein [Cryptosporangium aurantiacum]|uniref:Uncharacterized protein n=1 Tax=Cryptosporangium aurantiacum TaxID=134849 RepID=A0A1M7RP95_9ACTN|nr:hypothetical protein [Cryptosporangium aurantiacum]SHN48074.1 hypothetical protein SAMN05443668_13321 [Cryptosporangium aurantiacum]
MSAPSAEHSATLSPEHAHALAIGLRYGVPESLVTAVRSARDGRGACRAAAVDVRFDLRTVRHAFGREIRDHLCDDLHHLAPDALRRHLPRQVHGAGCLRAGLVVALADYGPTTLVALTPPEALAAGERIQLALRPHADPRYRLDRHRHHWDTRGAAPAARHDPDDITRLQDAGDVRAAWTAAGIAIDGPEAALDRLAAVPVNLPALRSEARRCHPGADTVVFLPGRRLAVVLSGLDGPTVTAIVLPTGRAAGLPVLPEAAWARPVADELVRLGYLRRDAETAVPTRLRVSCGGRAHSVRLENGQWQAADHTPEQIARERALARLGGPLGGCLRVIEERAADVETARDVDRYLQHGRVTDAQAVVTARLGAAVTVESLAPEPFARLREATLRYRLHLAGLPPLVPAPPHTIRPPRKGARHHQVIR